jgi:hypothetical protein
VLEKTYESERVDKQRSDCMREGSYAKDIEVQAGDNQVPEEISSRERLDEARSTSITPDALFPLHIAEFGINEHNPYGEAVDQAALNHRDNVSIPIQSPLPGQLRVVLRS